MFTFVFSVLLSRLTWINVTVCKYVKYCVLKSKPVIFVDLAVSSFNVKKEIIKHSTRAINLLICFSLSALVIFDCQCRAVQHHPTRYT